MRGCPQSGALANFQNVQIQLTHAVIRSYRPTDVASITRHIGTYSVARNMSAIPHPYLECHAEEWIATATKREPETHFAIAIHDEVVGGIGVEIGDARGTEASKCCAEIGYWLGEPFWGHGVATEALVALTDWAFANLPLVRLHAAVFAWNPASARVLQKAGYEFEGRMKARYFREDQYIDGLLYAIVRIPNSDAT
jgi:[ribosomal protein S5]-alanine N-acetyltransferase